MKYAVYYQRDGEIFCDFLKTEAEANARALALIERFNKMEFEEQAAEAGGFDVTILRVVAAVARTLNEYHLDSRPFKEGA
jgi:hypothetical protein